MEKHEMDIEIRPDGEVKIHIKGAKGKECLKYANLFEKILDGKGKREKTHEYYEPETGVKVSLEVNEGR